MHTALDWHCAQLVSNYLQAPGKPLPEAGLQLTVRFDGETPRIKIPFQRSSKKQGLGYFGVAFGKGTVLTIEVPWEVPAGVSCCATYSIDLCHEDNQKGKLVISSSAQHDKRRRRG